jgi:glutamyl-tRNA synthetase
LKEAAEYILKLRQEPEYPADLLVFKKSTKEASLKGLQNTKYQIQNTDTVEWNADKLQEALMAVVLEQDLTNGDVFWPVRVALSGEERSPSPVELMVALGKEESLKRIEKAVEKLKA